MRTGNSPQHSSLINRITDTRSGPSLVCLGYLSGPRAMSLCSGLMFQAYSKAQPEGKNQAYENYPVTGPMISLPSTQYNQCHRAMSDANTSRYGAPTGDIDAHCYTGTARQEVSAYRLTDAFSQHHRRRLWPSRSENASYTVDNVSNMVHPSFGSTPSCEYNQSLYRTGCELSNSFNYGPTYSPLPLSCMCPPQANGKNLNDNRPYGDIYRHEDEMEDMTAANSIS